MARQLSGGSHVFEDGGVMLSRGGIRVTNNSY